MVLRRRRRCKSSTSPQALSSNFACSSDISKESFATSCPMLFAGGTSREGFNYSHPFVTLRIRQSCLSCSRWYKSYFCGGRTSLWSQKMDRHSTPGRSRPTTVSFSLPSTTRPHRRWEQMVAKRGQRSFKHLSAASTSVSKRLSSTSHHY